MRRRNETSTKQWCNSVRCIHLPSSSCSSLHGNQGQWRLAVAWIAIWQIGADMQTSGRQAYPGTRFLPAVYRRHVLFIQIRRKATDYLCILFQHLNDYWIIIHMAKCVFSARLKYFFLVILTTLTRFAREQFLGVSIEAPYRTALKHKCHTKAFY